MPGTGFEQCVLRPVPVETRRRVGWGRDMSAVMSLPIPCSPETRAPSEVTGNLGNLRRDWGTWLLGRLVSPLGIEVADKAVHRSVA